MATLAVFSMRALGIPVTFDFSPMQIYTDVGHSWNSVNNLGTYIPFMGAQTEPLSYAVRGIPSIVYRKMFALQPNNLTANHDTPRRLTIFQNVKNVTELYSIVSDIRVPLRYPPTRPTDHVYLAFSKDEQWHIVAWTENKGETALFTSIRVNMLYLPVYYVRGRKVPAGDPFWLDADGNMTFLTKNDEMTLLRFNVKKGCENSFRQSMRNGRFEGANNPDFSDAQLLHAISYEPNPFFNVGRVTRTGKFRYVRYISPTGSRNHVSEIAFFDENNNKLTGQSMSSARGVDATLRNRAFDNNITTFYVVQNGGWIGLDLQEPRTIRRIHYLPHTTQNNTFKGHEYELFYWTKQGWQSLGMQTATSGHLQFHVPKGALFRLANRTLSREGQAFFIAPNGEIQWTR